MSVIAHHRLIETLEAHGCRGGRGQFQCPVHDDGTPSLTVTDKPDRVLVHCHAGCDTLDVLEKIGLGWGDLFDEPAAGKGWTTSTLRKFGARANGDGRIEFGTVRYMPGGSPKTLAVKGSKRDLCPDPETVDGNVLFVVEGEPDAVTATDRGLPAVAIPGVGKWDPSWAARIAKGRARVVIIPDADDSGRRAAQKWAAAIAEHCGDVRVLDLEPDYVDGRDLSDYCSDAITASDRAELRRAIMGAAETVKPFTPEGVVVIPDPRETLTTTPSPDRYAGRVVDLDALLAKPPQPLPWRVHDIVADGTLTILSGESGAGKSWLAQALCTGVAQGRAVAGLPCVKGTALYIDAEMGPRMFVDQRLRPTGVARAGFEYVDAMGLDISTPGDLTWIRGQIERMGAKLVVIDSLRRLTPSKSENDSDDMAPAVSALAKVARDTDAAILLVHHKGDSDKFFRGSTAIKDQADALFALLRDPDDEHAPRRLRCRGGRGKMRYALEPPDLYLDISPEDGGVSASDAPEHVPVVPARAAVAVAIKAAMPAKTKTEVAEKVGRGLNDNSFRGAWGDLEESGEITKISGHWELCSRHQTLDNPMTTKSRGVEGTGAVAS